MKINNDNICIDIIDISVTQLLDKHADERGLFRSTVPQVDVRNLQEQLYNYIKEKQNENEKKIKSLLASIKDSDPYTLAEVIQTSLKEMKYPLFYDIYNSFLELELIENNFELNIKNVKSLLENISEPKFTIIKKIFFLLSHLISLEENDASIVQLAHVISPTVCRPITSAFMSLRHMEDLKKIRPIVLFLMENCHDIFDGLSSKNPNPNYGMSKTPKSNKEALILKYYQDQSTTSSSSTPKSPPPGVPRLNLSIDFNKTSETSEGFIKPNLLVTIPNSSSDDGSDSSITSSSANSTSSDINHKSYSDNEWKILHALINYRVSSFTSLTEKETAFFISNENQNESYFSAMQSHLIRNMQANTSPSKDISLSPSAAATSSSNGATSSIGMNNLSSPSNTSKFAGSSLSPSNMSLSSPNSLKNSFFLKDSESNQSKSLARRNNRRRLVSVCRCLRIQIQEFEENFKKEKDRMPKGSEKGEMTQIYARYRELKKEIREGSATDLQRVFRGYLARLKFKNKRNNINSAPQQSTPSTNSTSTTTSSNLSEENNLISQYREYSEAKKELKKKLKKFDEDFELKHNKPPVKSDKEVIRPLYQRYHDIKKKLDTIKKSLIAMNAHIPDDLLEEINGVAPPSAASSSSSSNILSYSTTLPIETSGSSSSKKPQLSISTESPRVEDEFVFSANNTPTSANAANAASFNSASQAERDNILESLMQEKKALHMHLKVFERNFLKKNSRPVTRSEDISPVAAEYQRYKEIKALISELKSSKKNTNV